MNTIDLISALGAEAKGVPVQSETNPRKAILVDREDSAPYYVHPEAKVRYARELWHNPTRTLILYEQAKKRTEPIATVSLSEDTRAYVYEAPALEGSVWGEVRGAAVDTFLGLAGDVVEIVRRAQDLDLSHITPDENW